MKQRTPKGTTFPLENRNGKKLNRTYFIVCSLVLLLATVKTDAQVNPLFFPDFQPYPSNPIIRYGDGFPDAAWNDPCVLKENGQYIMYITAADGIFLSNSNTVKVYRQVSNDGYNWTLSPLTPIVEPVPGTYYEGGTETPSVVFKDSVYHMYLTCYPPGNLQTEFVLAHTTSPDGINFTMDTIPVLESDGSPTIYGDLVGEPGAMVYNDSIYLFFTTAGTVSNIPVQGIGLIKSGDGTHFSTPQLAVQLPASVYPGNSYWGLSTPSALAINDSIYLFTDVAEIINGAWTQVALHQFKTDSFTNVWYHDTVPVHTMQDFVWTDGDYLSEIRSITPLLDDNGILRIWYAGNRLADVSGNDTTYNVIIDSLGNIHVDPDFWGIGTSEYQLLTSDGRHESLAAEPGLQVFPNPARDFIQLKSPDGMNKATVRVYDITGRAVKTIAGVNGTVYHLSLEGLQPGLYVAEVETEGHNYRDRFIKQ